MFIFLLLVKPISAPPFRYIPIQVLSCVLCLYNHRPCLLWETPKTYSFVFLPRHRPQCKTIQVICPLKYCTNRWLYLLGYFSSTTPRLLARPPSRVRNGVLLYVTYREVYVYRIVSKHHLSTQVCRSHTGSVLRLRPGDRGLRYEVWWSDKTVDM